MAAPPTPELLVPDAAAWRAWLERHHGEQQGVWLVLQRGTAPGPTALTHAAALTEALCFGWIDGQVRPRDAATWRVRFTPRRPRSRWSRRNVEKALQLLREGRLHPAGIAEVERARADGRWAAAYPGVSQAEVPADLEAALRASARARENFGRLTAQNRYAILYRLHHAAPSRRAARLEAFVRMLERGETTHPQRAPLEGGGSAPEGR